MEASRAGILASLEVVSAVVLAFIVLGEPMSIFKLIGVAVLFGSILLVNEKEAMQDLNIPKPETVGYNS